MITARNLYKFYFCQFLVCMPLILMKLFLIFFILLCNLVNSKLSLLTIKEVMNDLNVLNTKHFEIQSSIINPIFGYLLESTGTLSNIRFFGPGMQIIKENNSRDYSKDSSDNSIVRLTLETFPSPAGTLCHIRNLPNNFGFKFQADRAVGIEFLADCFVKMLDSKANTNYKDENECEEFRKVRNILFSLDDEHIFVEIDSKMIKLMIIHSFIINALDNKTSLEKYLKIIIENTKDTHIDVYEVGCNITDEVIKIQQKFRNFPYSEFNQPSSNASVPIYNRKTDKFNFEKKYSDCADILLLNICNCLFYDSENCCYSIKSLNPNSDLAKFYKKHSELFTVTDAIRQDWSKVIQGLDDFEIVNDDEHKTHLIVYLKENRNELKSGIINMMNVLIKICNVDHKAFWKGFDGKDIEEKIIQLFELISPKFEKQTLRLKAYPFSFTKFRSKRRTDFIGNFKLKFTLFSKDLITMLVIQDLAHANMKFIKNTRNRENNAKNQTINSNLEKLPTVIFKNFISIAQQNSNTVGKLDLFSKLYLSGYMETNEQKKAKLIAICREILYHQIANKNQCKNTNEKINEQALKKIISTIIDTICLESDNATRTFFGPFLFNYDGLNNDMIVENWIMSFGIEEIDIYKLWEEKILNLKFKSLSLELYSIPLAKIPPLFNTLRKCKELKSLRVLGLNIENQDLFAKELKELKNLTKLNLSYNYFGTWDKSFCPILDALEHIGNLKSLDLSENYLDVVNTEFIGKMFQKLPNLTCLNLSCNQFSNNGIYKLSKGLKILKKLTSLNLSKNVIGSEGIKLISNVILEMPLLTSLNLSFNCFGIEGAELILNTLEKTKSIVNLNLAFTLMTVEEENTIWLKRFKISSLINFKI